MKDKKQKNTQLRNNEYFKIQYLFDLLYDKAQKGHKFNNLIKHITHRDNIRLAYRNIKNNKGSNAKGISGRCMNWVSNLSLFGYIEFIHRKLNNYTSSKIRRVGIPKSNGKIRYLGITEPDEKIIEQAILQIIEPICYAHFHNNSNGFMKSRSCTRAINQMTNYILKEKLYFVVDIDIKGFFDNIDHGKLLKQLYTLGIQDKNLLSIISKMLKSEIQGVGIPEKGTPQGGVLSPLLANVVLNELDWWLESKLAMGIRFVRYADDFKILCPSYQIAKYMLDKTTKWLKFRLKLEVSEEKTKIVNLKKNYSDFLGIRIKLKQRKGKISIESHIKNNAIKTTYKTLKQEVRKIKWNISKPKMLEKLINNYNSIVRGFHNYFDVATEINWDLHMVNEFINKYIAIKLEDFLLYSNKFDDKTITEKYCTNGTKLPCIRGKPIIPIGNIRHEYIIRRCYNINYYNEKSRKRIHKELRIDNEFIMYKLLSNPEMNKSVEFNDNVIPLFCGQLGRCRITKEMILNYKYIKVIKIRTNGSDKYNNLMIVNRRIAELLTTKGDDITLVMQLKVGLSPTQLREINSIRKENGLNLV